MGLPHGVNTADGEVIDDVADHRRRELLGLRDNPNRIEGSCQYVRVIISGSAHIAEETFGSSEKLSTLVARKIYECSGQPGDPRNEMLRSRGGRLSAKVG